MDVVSLPFLLALARSVFEGGVILKRLVYRDKYGWFIVKVGKGLDFTYYAYNMDMLDDIDRNRAERKLIPYNVACECRSFNEAFRTICDIEMKEVVDSVIL